MAYTRTNEEARVVINLDFSLVVPKGTSYEFNEEDLPSGSEGLPENSGLVLDFVQPRPVHVGEDLSDPITRGVVKNYAAGIFIDCYGTDVKQAAAFESKHAMAIYGLKTSRSGVGYFVVVTERGLYQGRAVIPGMPNKERLALLREVLSSLTKYGSTPSEIEAVENKTRKDKQEQERTRRLEEEAARRRKAARQAQEAAAAAAAATEEKTASGEEQSQETSGSKEMACDKQPEAGTETGTGASETGNVTGSAEKVPSAETTKAPEAPGTAAGAAGTPGTEERAEAAEDKETVENGNTAPATGNKGSDGKAAEDNKEAAAPEETLTPEEQHIRELEREREQHLDELRARFAGNPQVEAGIDNYIARVDHTGDEIARTFLKFLTNVQEYAANTQFTSESDPAYLQMISGIREEEQGLGRKLDDLARSVNTNVSQAVEAGITEPFVERMIRMVERLDARYDKLAVSMNGQDRIAYHRPTEVDEIIVKWKNFRENLPSHLKETDARREIETGNRIQERIKAERSHLLEQQDVTAKAQEHLLELEEDLTHKEEEASAFEAVFEDRKQEIETERKERIRSNQEALDTLEGQIKENQAKVDELAGELSKTFALNMNKKRTLSSQIEELNDVIASQDTRRTELEAAGRTFEQDAADKTAALEEERTRLQSQLQEARENRDAQTAVLQQAQEELAGSRERLASSEDEWKHVHEYYLMGKYD